MTPDPEYGDPDVEAVTALLNAAYGRWGDPEMFEWLCAQPDPLHHWWVVDDGVHVGYESGVERELRTADGESLTTVLRGNAAVAPSHTGQGIWSSLVDAIDAGIHEGGQELSVKFTNRDYKTYGVAKSDGYADRTLPLYVNILSEKRAIDVHASGLLDLDGATASVAARVLGGVEIDVDDGRINVGELLGLDATSGPSLTIPLAGETVTGLVETAAAEVDSTAALLATGARSVGGRKLAALRRGTQAVTDGGRSVGIERTDDPSDDAIADLHSLYEAVNREFDYYFRREEQDIRHLLAHPELETTLWLRRDEDLVGFAALRWEPMEAHDELWVSDAVAINERARETLHNEIERVAADSGADIVAMLSTEEPNSQWARVEKQAVVWNPFNTSEGLNDRLQTGSWRMGIYDVE